MSYTKGQLSATTKKAVINDIKAIEWEGEPVYPDYPDGYEVAKSSFKRFIVTPPRREVLEPAEFDSDGNKVKAAKLGNWRSKLVLPEGFNLSVFKTLSND